MSYQLHCQRIHAPEKVKNPPLPPVTIFIMLHIPGKLKCWVLCHKFQEHSGVQKYVVTGIWRKTRTEERSGRSSLKLSILPPSLHFFQGKAKRQEKMRQKTPTNSKGCHLSQNVTPSSLLVTNIFRLKVRCIHISLSLILNTQPLWITLVCLMTWTQAKLMVASFAPPYSSSPGYDDNCSMMRFLMRQRREEEQTCFLRPRWEEP